MTWMKQQCYNQRHRCDFPYINNEHVSIGDLWQCDTCLTVWKVGFNSFMCDRVWRKKLWRTIYQKLYQKTLENVS